MVKAIDTHVHPSTREWTDAMRDVMEVSARYFRTEVVVRTEEEMAQEFRDLDMMAVLLSYDCETATGYPHVPNDRVAEIVQNHPDVFVGFAGVDPWKGKMAIKELERCVKELGLIGAKFQQSAQAFFPNDQRFYPLWEKCQELRVPVLFHCGITGLGAGAPGGMGFKQKYTQPIHIDDVAADFPELTIICAHPAWPWQDEMIAIALHKANVYIDLSGWSPKYFPPQLTREVNSRLQDKALFGTDYPLMSPQRWLKDFEGLDLKPEVRQKVLLENAKRVLRIETP